MITGQEVNRSPKAIQAEAAAKEEANSKRNASA